MALKYSSRLLLHVTYTPLAGQAASQYCWAPTACRHEGSHSLSTFQSAARIGPGCAADATVCLPHAMHAPAQPPHPPSGRLSAALAVVCWFCCCSLDCLPSPSVSSLPGALAAWRVRCRF